MNDVLTPHELAEQGKAEYQSGNFESAAQLFAAAAEGFAASGNKLDAAEMRNNQSVALLQNKDAKGAYEAVKGTADIFADAGDIRRKGFALGNEGSALEALGNWKEAAQKYRESADTLEEAGEEQMRAQVLQSLSALQVKHAQAIDAVITMQDGLAGVKQPTLKQKILKQLVRFRSFW
jgi:tetratricopeptide (TPR) repeat protein